MTREENIDIMIEVMSDLSLHLKACQGYKYTGTTVAFDGSEDGVICREAKDFWNELSMRQKINAAVADVEARYKAGELPWTWATVQSLIGRYPRRGQLDVLKPGQEDEATPDPDGVPWEPERVEDLGGDASPTGDDCEQEGCELVPVEEPWDYEQGEANHRGYGDDQQAKGAASAKGATSGTELSQDQADSLLGHSGRLQALQQAKDILANLGGAMGASLKHTVALVMSTESKRFRHRMQGDAAVAAELRTPLETEEAHQSKHVLSSRQNGSKCARRSAWIAS